jgi:cysteine desulfurase
MKRFEMMPIYLDHASATPVSNEVLEAMLPYFSERYANPSNVYDISAEIKQTLETQRGSAAKLIHAKPSEIIFTSSGAEANNLAIKGTAFAKRNKGQHIIVSLIEHHSVLNSARFLERLDFEVTFLPVDGNGFVDPERLNKVIRSETILVSVQHASNEIGTIQPISELSSLCKKHSIIFHTDAVATVGNIPVNVHELGVDLLSFSGPSFGGPKGTGALFFKKNTRLMPLIHGGIQESGRRAGTENMPGIVGFGRAAELVAIGLPEKEKHVRKLRDRLITGVLDHIEKVTLTGHPKDRLPGHASFCFEGIEGEALIFMIAASSIYANTGSACASKALKTSPVLGAIGIRADLAQGSIVFTFNQSNTIEQIEYTLNKLEKAVKRLRSFSPIWGKDLPENEEGVCT